MFQNAWAIGRESANLMRIAMCAVIKWWALYPGNSAFCKNGATCIEIQKQSEWRTFLITERDRKMMSLPYLNAEHLYCMEVPIVDMYSNSL